MFCRGFFCILLELKKYIMTTNEIYALVFILFSIVSFLLRDKYIFFKGTWFVLKSFYIALLMVLAYGFIQEQLKKK